MIRIVQYLINEGIDFKYNAPTDLAYEYVEFDQYQILYDNDYCIFVVNDDNTLRSYSYGDEIGVIHHLLMEGV